MSVPNSISYSLSSILQIVDAPWYSTKFPEMENNKEKIIEENLKRKDDNVNKKIIH